jgi:thiamine-phosphate pyrophosphorylase
LLINHRTDVALAVGADGVHLTGTDIAASDARALAAGRDTRRDNGRQFLVAVSCRSAPQVRLAEAHGADFAVLAPIFEKPGTNCSAIGLDELRRAACQAQASSDPQVEAGDHRKIIPVIALGGVDRESASLCAAAGASGIAGIRIFQQDRDLPELVRFLHSL